MSTMSSDPPTTGARPSPPAKPRPTAPQRPTGVIHPEVKATPAVLEIDRFSLSYGTKQVVHEVTAPIPQGQVTALIGPSGCGKSTMLRSINRLNDLISDVHVSGDIRLQGDSIFAPTVDVIELRKRLGMVFQKSNPFPMSIYENVIYALRIDGEKRRAVLDEVVERSLHQAALWDEVKDRLHDSGLALSGGQQQRLCIARAMAAQPEVLLMDEPCSALDPVATAKIESLIHDLREHFTILIVTHNMQQAARVSDFTAFMLLGRLIEFGPTSTIFQMPRHKETNDYVSGRFG